MSFLAIWLKSKLLLMLWACKGLLIVLTALLGLRMFLIDDLTQILNLLILYMYLNVQTLLCDVEDSREKLDRFFSYNFLFFEDD